MLEGFKMEEKRNELEALLEQPDSNLTPIGKERIEQLKKEMSLDDCQSDTGEY